MIPLYLEQEADFFCPYDPTRTRIDKSIYEYLKSYCIEFETDRNTHDTIEITCNGPFDTALAKRALNDAVNRDRDEYDRQIKLNRKRMIQGFVIGTILSVLGVALAVILNQVLLEIISFLGTLSISDTITIVLETNPDIKRLKRLLEPYSELELKVVDGLR